MKSTQSQQPAETEACTLESSSENKDSIEQTTCPVPLGWKKVVATFQEDATTWNIPFKETTLTGKTWGTGPVLIITGSLTSKPNLFSLLVYLLREEFTCILYEPSDSQSQTPKSLSEELIAVADHHSASQFHLYASGFGSVAALSTALNHPKRINKMILQGGFAHRKLSLVERFLIFCGRLFPGKLQSLPGFQTIFVENHRRWFPPFDGSRWEFLSQEVGEHRIKRIARLASVLKVFDVKNQLSNISHQTLLLRTEGDGAVLADHQQQLLNSMPNVQEEYLQHTGYLTYLTHPHRIAKIIRPFLLDEQEKS